ncbi:MAG: SpoIIE family protein phosphatase [bacterium]|nr:SpoIIE family protein phosphatase [bacterium]
MHPILGHGGRLILYLAAWLPGGLLLATVAALVGDVAWYEAVALAFPLSQIYAFICLAAWYPSRTIPASRAHVWQAITRHAVAAILSSSIWQLAGGAWALLLSYLPIFSNAYENFTQQIIPLFFAVGLLLYLLAAAGSYVYIAFETSREAQKRALEAQKNQELAAKELELARSIQQRLLPPAEQEGPGFRLAARNLAAQFVAGDFYDYFRLPDGSLRIAVADVAGKGIAASLIMATVKAMLPLIAAERSVVETLRELNRKLASELAAREFVALALAGFDPRTGRLELANAGLPDPYLLRPDAATTTIEAPVPRLPLGLRDEVEYRSVEVELGLADRVLFITDGLPEAPIVAGEPLGYEALRGFLDHREPLPAGWLDRLLDRLREATVAEQDDDWTALVLERTEA